MLVYHLARADKHALQVAVRRHPIAIAGVVEETTTQKATSLELSPLAFLPELS